MRSTVKQQITGVSGWVIALGLTLVGALVALVLSMLATPQYEAHARMYVSTTGGAPVSNASYQETSASQQIALSLVKLIQSEAVTERVVDSLQLDMSASALAEKMEASVEPETVLIDLTVTDSSPVLAREIANANAFEFADFVDELQLKTAPSTPRPKVTLVKPAATPTAPVSPNVPRNVGLGAVAGLALGFAAASLRGRAIRTVQTSQELEDVTGAAPLGAVPSVQLSGGDAFARVTGNAALMESFRDIRTNLVHLLESSSSRVVAVSSAGLEEGKTTTVCGVAAALSDAGHRVLVIDADLRQARLTQSLDMSKDAGLADALDGVAEAHAVIRSMEHPKVDVLPAGQISSQPSELLASRAAEKLVQQVGESYDYVLLDTPALLAYTDAAVLATHSDGVLLTARYAGVDDDDLRAAMARLSRVDAPFLGAVLTFAPMSHTLRRSLKRSGRR
ncbi:polysaccharide biosynthesis tyrosine autokinase [Mycobacterium sp. C31M]